MPDPLAPDALTQLLSQLDVEEEVVEQADGEMKRIARWLGTDPEALALDPSFYPQGSFLLGTPVRPVRDSDDFDIDIVCRLLLSKRETTQKELKDLVGSRLKADPEMAGVIHESRRCWTIQYPQFHLDVLPAIPAQDEGGDTAILITDRDLHRWQPSDPKGYARWFFDRMSQELGQRRMVVAEQRGVEIEDVPEWAVRTHLQRAVQIIKRHRDVRFRGDPDDKPISVIITTLAATAYRPAESLFDVITDVVGRMPASIAYEDGTWLVPNPVRPEENFADKWNEYPERKEAFDGWLTDLALDVRVLKRGTGQEQRRVLEESLEIDPPAKDTVRSTLPAPILPRLPDVPHREPVRWDVELLGTCEVVCEADPRRGGPRHNLRSGRPIPKRMGLTFSCRYDVPEADEVRWQVTNTGAEARRRGQLRGQFETSNVAGRRRFEETAFAGAHYVQAFVLAGGKVRAISDPFIVVVKA